jgi:hypothetical protein
MIGGNVISAATTGTTEETALVSVTEIGIAIVIATVIGGAIVEAMTEEATASAWQSREAMPPD